MIDPGTAIRLVRAFSSVGAELRGSWFGRQTDNPAHRRQEAGAANAEGKHDHQNRPTSNHAMASKAVAPPVTVEMWEAFWSARPLPRRSLPIFAAFTKTTWVVPVRMMQDGDRVARRRMLQSSRIGQRLD